MSMRRSKKNPDKSPYDENGRWVEERSRIKGAIRRVFRLSPQMEEVIKKARVELPPKLKKDGTPGAKNQIRYRCAVCSELFSQKHVQVDHIEPVVPLHLREVDMTIDQIARGIFCGVDNLQVICSTPKKLSKDGKPSCHSVKTNEENFIRDSLAKLGFDPELIRSQIEILKKGYQLKLLDDEEKRKQKVLRRIAREEKRLARKAKAS
jgi:hypothetical protein